MDFCGFEMFWEQNVGPPVAACDALRQRLDPPNIKISDSGGLNLEAWCLDAGIGMDWRR